MKILIASTSTADTESIAAGLAYIGQHEISLFHYDMRSTESTRLHMRQDRVERARNPLDGTAAYVTCDPELLNHAHEMAPDIVLFISAWGSAFMPTNETLLRLKDMAPLVHLLFDGADPPWWEPLRAWEAAGVFDLTVSIDGCHDWPGGSEWAGGADGRIENGITLLTPISPVFFPPPSIAFHERPFPIGYAGNVGGWMRKGVVERLQQENMPFVLKMRDDAPYGDYATFLQHCRIIVNVPFTGSGARKHVKGRVVEAGLAKACLLEWNNPRLRDWFHPRREYEEYDNPDHLIEMARFLIGQTKRCEEIGEALYRRVRQDHDPAEFWEQVFDRVKFRTKSAAE